MAEDIEAQLATSMRREAALAGVLNAVASGGADVESVLYEIAMQASVLTGADLGYVFMAEGQVHVLERPWPGTTVLRGGKRRVTDRSRGAPHPSSRCV